MSPPGPIQTPTSTPMQLFKHILKEPEPEVLWVERRRAQRFTLHPDFPLKSVLSFIGRDDTGVPMSDSRHAWHWKGRLIDCSERGMRMRLGSGVRAHPGDECDLLLTLEDFELTVPCHISNVRAEPEGTTVGLQHDIADEATWAAYQQLLEVVALSSTLKPAFKHTKPDPSGYWVEQYASERLARLTVWRHPANQAVVAFEFLLKEVLMRAAAGLEVEFLIGAQAAEVRPVPPSKEGEVRRLFHWVAPNLAPCVPADVRAFVRYYAT